MIIDFHAHIYPEKAAEKVISSMEDYYGVKRKHSAVINDLITSMDKGGIDKAVILPVATRPEHIKNNEWYGDVGKKYPRIIPFGLIHPDNDASELDRFPELGLKGIKIQPNATRTYPDDEKYFPIYEKAKELGLLITFHIGDEEAGIKGEFSQPERYVNVLSSFPEITFILAHMGGYQVWHKAGELYDFDNVFFDTAYVAGKYPDEKYIALAERIGYDRIVFGTDFPFRDHKEERDYIEKLFKDKAKLILEKIPEKISYKLKI
jgi:predicted TIM-barrel fold metal-dependent hydrolase